MLLCLSQRPIVRPSCPIWRLSRPSVITCLGSLYPQPLDKTVFFAQFSCGPAPPWLPTLTLDAGLVPSEHRFAMAFPCVLPVAVPGGRLFGLSSPLPLCCRLLRFNHLQYLATTLCDRTGFRPRSGSVPALPPYCCPAGYVQ